MIKVITESASTYAEVQVGMKWVIDEFTLTCTEINGDTCEISERWSSIDSDEEHSKVSTYNIIKGDTCDVLKDPEYPDDIGKLYVNSAINLDKFYPDYWDTILQK